MDASTQTPERSVSRLLREGLKAALATWSARGGEQELLYWVLCIKLERTQAGIERITRRIPLDLSAEVQRRTRAINQYFGNVRFALLDPLTQVWGTLVNALRAAANVDSVTSVQAETFDFSVRSLLALFRAAHEDMAMCEQLHLAFRPMPAPDCQMLAALFNVHIDLALDEDELRSLVRLLSAEGPLTAEENEAFAVLSRSGLTYAAFRGMRRAG
jgi:hypothetical protein